MELEAVEQWNHGTGGQNIWYEVVASSIKVVRRNNGIDVYRLEGDRTHTRLVKIRWNNH